MVGSGSDLLGPAVTVAHRLLKNTIRERIGFRPHLFLTAAAATALGLSQVGLAHREEYPDAGLIQGRIVGFGEPAHEGVPTYAAGRENVAAHTCTGPDQMLSAPGVLRSAHCQGREVLGNERRHPVRVSS
jgi:hypothetical protein